MGKTRERGKPSSLQLFTVTKTVTEGGTSGPAHQVVAAALFRAKSSTLLRLTVGTLSE